MSPRVSVVIPSLSRERAAGLERLKAALARQTHPDLEVLVVEGVSPQGKAINLGEARASGEVLVVMDDDSSIDDDRLIAKLVATLAADPRIGMAGASLQPGPGANRLQRRAARELPRFSVPVVDTVTDSDLACHGCAAFPRAAFVAAGREREDLVRGLDPDLRQRLRAAGYRVVLAPGCVVHHPLPATLGRLLAIFVRNGAGSARAQRLDPGAALETDERLEAKGFVAHRPFLYRAVRLPLRVLWAALTLQPLRALVYTAYAYGYLRAWLTGR
jgi:glycosyltransferase involved in cell wall biosynthesis